MTDIFALVDCNNFYASCERLFSPSLEGKPVVVLSNNDGCVIARTDEAKNLGIGMGVPVFEIQNIILCNNVHVFSTNYALYGDISQRVMNVLSSMVPDMEIYSIDEAFLDFSHIDKDQIMDVSKEICERVLQFTGIPVSIGIGKTKTLAKAANQLAKIRNDGEGVCSLIEEVHINDCLARIPVSEVWGVGEKFNAFFQRSGIFSAGDLKLADENRLREQLGVAGQRLVLELSGKICYQLHSNPEIKKEICTSRSFGHPIDSYEELEEATTSYAAKVAYKLREQESVAQTILVFVMTNKYAPGPQYVNYQVVNLPTPSNQTQVIIQYAIKALSILFRKGYKYKKTGIIAAGLLPSSVSQLSLWSQGNTERSSTLLETMDQINKKHGLEKVKFAVQGDGQTWKMRQHNLSPNYCTRWDEILTVGMDL